MNKKELEKLNKKAEILNKKYQHLEDEQFKRMNSPEARQRFADDLEECGYLDCMIETKKEMDRNKKRNG